MLGASFDSPADNAAFKETVEFPFPLLSDEDKAVGTAYGVLRDADDPFSDFPKRVSFLINPDGVVAKVYEVDDPAGHAAAVLVDLAAEQR